MREAAAQDPTKSTQCVELSGAILAAVLVSGGWTYGEKEREIATINTYCLKPENANMYRCHGSLGTSTCSD